MGFNRKIRETVFVASARRCCVCRKFKGRNLEVHHITHSSQGGDDTYEKAIPLCFDYQALLYIVITKNQYQSNIKSLISLILLLISIASSSEIFKLSFSV